MKEKGYVVLTKKITVFFWLNTNQLYLHCMNIKTDTKEKFTVISPNYATLTANITAHVITFLSNYLQQEVPHIVLNMASVVDIDKQSGENIASIQQQFYDNNASFVICCLNEQVKHTLESLELLEVMNVTPTESEAWDIVQMEEIERELLGD